MHPEGPQKPGRRKFMKGTAAGVAAVMVGGPVVLEVGDDIRRSAGRFLERLLERRKLLSRERGWEHLTKEQREVLIEVEVKDYKEYLALEGDAVLGNERSTDEQILAVLRALPWYTHRQLEGTKYDFSPENWPSVTLSRAFAPKGAADNIVVSRLDGKGNVNYIGNGTWVRMPDGKLSLLTNIHVLASVLRVDGIIDTTAFEEVRYDEDVDAVFVRFTDAYMQDLERRLAIPAEYPFEDIPESAAVHGTLVRFPAIDKDETSITPDGRKLYASVGIRVTPRLGRFLTEYCGRGGFSEDDLIYGAPPGETRNQTEDRRSFLTRAAHKLQGVVPWGEYRSFAQGTSGTAAVSLRDGRNVVVGINRAVGGRIIMGKNVFDFMLMNGPDTVRAAAEHSLVLDMNKPPLRENLSSSYEGSGYEYEDNGGWSGPASDK